MSGGIAASTVGQVLVERSLLGWKEFEARPQPQPPPPRPCGALSRAAAQLEVMRDLADNVVIVCSIENIDPMGVHTGDSITVAPAQTLTDREYQRMRDAAAAIIREIGVECAAAAVGPGRAAWGGGRGPRVRRLGAPGPRGLTPPAFPPPGAAAATCSSR